MSTEIEWSGDPGWSEMTLLPTETTELIAQSSRYLLFPTYLSFPFFAWVKIDRQTICPLKRKTVGVSIPD
jgi:hypothetical protein